MNNLKALASPLVRCGLGLAASCLFAGAALADDTLIVTPIDRNHVQVQKEVRFGDLDLASTGGRAALDRRIRFAASDVCDGQSASASKAAVAFLDCYVVARDTARAQVSGRLASLQNSTVVAAR